MPTPLFNFRLPQTEAARLHEVATIYFGKKGKASEFVRTLLSAVLSGDTTRLANFLTTLQERMTGQMHLELREVVEREVRKRTGAAPPRKRRLKRKGKGGRRGGAT